MQTGMAATVVVCAIPGRDWYGNGQVMLETLVWLFSKTERRFSAGNGPAMRAAIFGVGIADIEKRHAYVKASTQMTHTDSKALTGAIAVADLAEWCIRYDSKELPPCEEIIALLLGIEPQDKAWCNLVAQMKHGWENNLSAMEFADQLGLQKSVTGYIYHTVPVAIYAWYRHFGDYQQTLEAVIECGGDTDTVGAIAGALAGAIVGESGIPKDWINGIWDAPINVMLLRKIAGLLEKQHGRIRYFWLLAIPRNMFFLLIVLLHGFRRLLPPY